MDQNSSVFDQPAAATLTHDEPPPGLERWTGDRSFFGHPKGLVTLSATEMWERFSFYGIRPLLLLFMTAALSSGGFGFSRTVASSIVGIYAASVYLASVPGGWIADRWLGLQRSIKCGAYLIALGHISIALSAIFAREAFFLGLVLIVIGTGLLKPNASAIVGDLYPEGGARRDAGFSVFYMCFNLGALVAPIITGYLGERVGWHWGFGAAGVGMLCGVIWFQLRAKPTLGPIGAEPRGTLAQQKSVRNWTLSAAAALFVVGVLATLGIIVIDPVSLAQKMTLIIGTIAVCYFGYLFFAAGLTTDEKKRAVVILILFIFSSIFWGAFEQAPTSLNLFARDFTDRVVFGFETPTTWLQSAQPFFVVTLAPVFAWLWVALQKRGINMSSPAKFSFALACAAIGFFIMVPAANLVVAGGPTVRVSIWWLTISYLFQTFGELSLSPVGLSSMTKLAPPRLVGQLMGVWFMGIALGDLAAGLVGGHVNPENLQQMPQLFMRTAVSLSIAAVILALLATPIRKMMRESSVTTA